LRGRGADRDVCRFVANARRLADARDVDAAYRARKPHGEQWHQRLPAGNDARARIVGKAR
jgi:hypothetical protein